MFFVATRIITIVFNKEVIFSDVLARFEFAIYKESY